MFIFQLWGVSSALESHHAEFPNRAIIGTEITHTLQTRGVYRTRTWYRTKDNPAPWEKPTEFKEMTQDRQIVWNVPYTTAGAAAKIEIAVDRQQVTANETDVIHCEITIVDNKGIMVPYANEMITFDINGPARIIGVENGDILDLSPHKVNYRKTFNGKCLLLVETTDKKGIIKITARAEGLESKAVKIKSINN